MRLAIAGLTLAATVVTASVVASSMVWAEGFMHFGSFAAPAFATLVGIVWMLCLVFGALLENNRALGRRAHRSWFAALVLTGPLAMLLYWALHVWPAPYVPRRDRD
jgi:adenosylmethionine-8-amino-7-oxononanoate aminotransferase